MCEREPAGALCELCVRVNVWEYVRVSECECAAVNVCVCVSMGMPGCECVCVTETAQQAQAPPGGRVESPAPVTRVCWETPTWSWILPPPRISHTQKITTRPQRLSHSPRGRPADRSLARPAVMPRVPTVCQAPKHLQGSLPFSRRGAWLSEERRSPLGYWWASVRARLTAGLLPLSLCSRHAALRAPP